MILSTCFAAWYSHQHQFSSIIIGVGLCFLAYFLVLRYHKLSFRGILIIGISCRISLLFFFPKLSDDVYRFFWDGILIQNGINPYGVLPNQVLNQFESLNDLIYQKLNSPEYFTIYPPVAQWFFGLSAKSVSIVQFSMVMKALMIAVEVIGMYYAAKSLRLLGKPLHLLAIYYLCPLVMLEGIGNLHFEVVMMAMLSISIYFHLKEDYLSSALFFALSVGAKLMPLMLLPYFLIHLNPKNSIKFFSGMAVFGIFIFYPLLVCDYIPSMLHSVDLYFRKFEFNASIYFILRELGQIISGYNLIRFIGPLLGIITVVVNLKTAIYANRIPSYTYYRYSCNAWFIYLLLATTVHPWYLISLVFLSIYTEAYKLVLVWSLLVFLSYSLYDIVWSRYHYILIGIEYSLLAIAYLYWSKKKTNPFINIHPMTFQTSK
jgi:hypothetical protein